MLRQVDQVLRAGTGGLHGTVTGNGQRLETGQVLPQCANRVGISRVDGVPLDGEFLRAERPETAPVILRRQRIAAPDVILEHDVAARKFELLASHVWPPD